MRSPFNVDHEQSYLPEVMSNCQARNSAMITSEKCISGIKQIKPNILCLKQLKEQKFDVARNRANKYHNDSDFSFCK